MTQKQITHLQDMIDDFMQQAMSDCTVESEGYPHAPYITSLGVSTTDFVHFIDEVNEYLGNAIELSQLLLDEPSFKQCMYNLSHNISEPEGLLKLVKTSDVVDSSNNKLICSIWKHNSGRLIQLLQQQNENYMKTLSCNEVIEQLNKQTRETDYILKGTV